MTAAPTKADLVARNVNLTEQIGAMKDRLARADAKRDTEAAAIADCVEALDDLTTSGSPFSSYSSRGQVVDAAAVERVLLYLADRFGARIQRIPEGSVTLEEFGA